MDYAQASEWLESLTNPERTGLSRRFARRMNLDATRRLMELLGNPHEQVTAAHVAGTKGKGSVAAMVESACRAAGHRTGLFTSPHLVSWRERIRIDGRCISEEQVAQLADEVRPAVEQVEAEGLRGPSFFEALTAMGMLAFAREDLDICVVEVGLGGRLDATNVLTPLVSVITTLGLDHTKVLGETLPQIAKQKAGIIKPNVPVVVARQPESIERLMRKMAQDAGAPIRFATRFRLLDDPPLSPDEIGPGEVPRLGERVAGQFRDEDVEAHIPLVGRHQALNAGVAAATCEALHQAGVPIPHRAFTDGLEGVYWPSRVELVATHPWEVLDCAHNQASARALMEALRHHLKYERMILVLGISRDKPAEAIAQEFASASHVVLTEASLSRALPVEWLEDRTRSIWRSHEAIISAPDALKRAREIAGPRDLICVTGSFFVVGDLVEAGLIGIPPCDL